MGNFVFNQAWYQPFVTKLYDPTMFRGSEEACERVSHALNRQHSFVTTTSEILRNFTICVP